jgi:CubicO group peptidase (beta-lactamase class C family)
VGLAEVAEAPARCLTVATAVDGRQRGRMRTLLVLFLTAVAASNAVAQAPDPFDPERFARVEALLQGAVEKGELAGYSYLLLHGEAAAEGAGGFADIAGERRMRTDTIVAIYSMSKPITAIAALVALEQGKLRLDQPIADFLPEFKQMQVLSDGAVEIGKTVAASRPITVRMLLNHTAGFSYDFAKGPIGEAYTAADLWTTGTLREFAAKVAKLPLRHQPGERFHYSIADDVLGAVIEAVTGQEFATFVAEQVTAPLGMVDTAYDVPEAKRERLATLYRRDQGKLVATEPILGAFPEGGRGFPGGGAGMFSTLADYGRFACFLLGDGSLDGVRVLGRKTMELARSNSLLPAHDMDQPGVRWNLVCGVVEQPGLGTELWSPGTLYWGGAASTAFWCDPEEGLVGVLFTQMFPYEGLKLATRFRTAVYQALR